MEMQRLQDSPAGWIKVAGAKNKSWPTRYVIVLRLIIRLLNVRGGIYDALSVSKPSRLNKARHLSRYSRYTLTQVSHVVSLSPPSPNAAIMLIVPSSKSRLNY